MRISPLHKQIMDVLANNHPLPLKHNFISLHVARSRDETLWRKIVNRSRFKSIGYQAVNKIKVSVTRSLRSLEKNGLVERRQFSSARTDVRWKLTDKGIELWQKMREG
jgi:GrpB-like predicted nucleotidyltransferase (UPF0157 family)